VGGRRRARGESNARACASEFWEHNSKYFIVRYLRANHRKTLPFQMGQWATQLLAAPNKLHGIDPDVAVSSRICTNHASRLSLSALRQNSEGVQGADRLTLRNRHVQPANQCSETSKRRKELNNSPANSGHCLCVMDAPEVYQPTGLVVISELFTAIQASDVGPSAIDKSASVKVGWD